MELQQKKVLYSDTKTDSLYYFLYVFTFMLITLFSYDTSSVRQIIKMDKKTKSTKKIDWVLRYCISKNAVYWCSKKRIDGKFHYSIYKDKAPGAILLAYVRDPEEEKKLQQEDRDICFLTANLYYIREEEQKAGLQRTDCDLSDVEDHEDFDHRKERIKKMLDKMKSVETKKPIIYPDPNFLLR